MIEASFVIHEDALRDKGAADVYEGMPVSLNNAGALSRPPVVQRCSAWQR